MKNYLFQTERLGFRNWLESDIQPFAEMNQDLEVMEYFPTTYSYEQTAAFIGRMQKQQEQKGFCYFAVDRLDTGEFIGFIGLSEQNYEAPFTPCIDIGWRLGKTHWGKGFATEGAKACLKYAAEQLKIQEVYAICSSNNAKSEKVMLKIGMEKQGDFLHPALASSPELHRCIYYLFATS